jgi:hypothetical protein
MLNEQLLKEPRGMNPPDVLAMLCKLKFVLSWMCTDGLAFSVTVADGTCSFGFRQLLEDSGKLTFLVIMNGSVVTTDACFVFMPRGT